MNEENKEKEYSLYTEKIVEPTGKKFRKVWKAIKYVVGVTILSAVAAVVFYGVTHFLEANNSKEKPNGNKVTLNIQGGDENSTTTSATDSTEPGTDEPTSSDKTQEGTVHDPLDDYKEFYATAMGLAKDSYKGLVVVSGMINTSQIFETVYENETIGAIIAYANDAYYIVTEYDAIKGADSIMITLYSGETAQATLLKGDSVTNLAVIMVDADLFDKNVQSRIQVMTLGDSNFVEGGAAVIAVGNVCNGNFTMNYGMASSIKNVIYDVDSKYRIINTNIACGPDCSGIIINTKGHLVGIITQNYENEFGESLISAYGISDIKNIVEQLTNDNNILYIGVVGREVTVDLSSAYAMPKGIYVLNIKANSPASKIGLQSGDIITAIDGTNIVTFYEFQQTIFKYKAGDEITLTVARRGTTGYRNLQYTITLAEK